MTDRNQKDWARFKEEVEQQAQEEAMMEDMLEDSDEEAIPHNAGLEHPDYKELEDKLTLAEQKAHENWEKSVRAVAELENVRRRMERDVANAHKFAAKKTIENLLPVMDSLEQALQLADNDSQAAAMKEGLELTMKIFLEALEKENVRQLNPVGEAFNPEEHEAMSMQETDEFPANTVVAVFQKGYVLHDRVVRPARVVVAKAKS